MVNTEDKAKISLVDADLIRYFKEVDTLPADDKFALLRVIGGFLRDVKTKQALSFVESKLLRAQEAKMQNQRLIPAPRRGA